MGDPLHPALRAVSDAVLAVASRRSVDDVLQGLVERQSKLRILRRMDVEIDQAGYGKGARRQTDEIIT